MIDVQIGTLGGRAYIRKDDLVMGKDIIYFGAGDGHECEVVKTDGLFERNIEGILTHETCHILIYGLTKDMSFTVKMDNVDNTRKNWPISGGFFAVCDER